MAQKHGKDHVCIYGHQLDTPQHKRSKSTKKNNVFGKLFFKGIIIKIPCLPLQFILRKWAPVPTKHGHIERDIWTLHQDYHNKSLNDTYLI